MIFRGLKPEEIEVRVGTVSKGGVSLLLYQDARCAMTILDETVGAENWQREHKEIKGNLYCGIGIKADALNKEANHTDWIWKWDCGTESYTEKEKGESSDSMKRAAVNVGIARELYTSPFIYIKAPTVQKGNKFYMTDETKKMINGAYVDVIEYEEIDNSRKISKLTICDKNGNALYDWNRGKNRIKQQKKTPEELAEVKKITKGGIDFLENLIRETKTDLSAVLSAYDITSLSDMTVEQFEKTSKILQQRLGK